MRLRLPTVLLMVAFASVAFASSRGKRARGASVFEVTGCRHCHTIDGAGGHKGPNLSGVGRRLSKAALRQQIMRGGKAMPAFGNVLDPGEIDDLIAYLHSCRKKPAKAKPASGSN